MKLKLAPIALVACCALAQAGEVITLKEPPSPVVGYFPLPDFPYTFATSYSDDGTSILGVCGYGAYYSRHTAYNCTWDLNGNVTLGDELSTLGSPPTKGQLYWFNFHYYFIQATNPDGYLLAFTDPAPRQSVLIKP